MAPRNVSTHIPAMTVRLDSSRFLSPMEVVTALRALRETSILFRSLTVKVNLKSNEF